MKQGLINWWGGRTRKTAYGNPYSYGNCDNCGKTFWNNREGGWTIYTKERLPKARCYQGTDHWTLCSECPPLHFMPEPFILRVYRSVKGELLCIECGRFHSAGVCYKTHSEEEVKVGQGMPIEIGPRLGKENEVHCMWMQQYRGESGNEGA